MPDDSPILSLPYIQPAQAQKHITHNEALRILDVIVQLVVQDRDLTEPPAVAEEGARHLVAPGAGGAWAGQGGQIALREQGQWSFLVPQTGWQAYVRAESRMVVFDGSAWVAAGAEALEAVRLGISASADAVNRLTVASPATLLTHAGGGHQLKVNKAAVSDTASLLFQTGFSGRAEMGLAGSDDFAIKVSPDGSLFLTGLSVAAASGVLQAPQGVQVADGSEAAPGFGFAAEAGLGVLRPGAGMLGLAAGGAVRAALSAAALSVSVPITGPAVTQTKADPTAGRLMKVGDFGLGAEATASQDFNTIEVSGLYAGEGSTAGMPQNSGQWLLLHVAQSAGSAAAASQIAVSRAAGSEGDLWTRARQPGGGWSGWGMVYSQRNLVGPVSQASGLPTGAVMERGSTSTGQYIRFADGTQIATQTVTTLTTGAASWVYPVAFAVPPQVSGLAVATAARITTLHSVTELEATVSAYTTAAARAVAPVRMMAVGRWF